MPTSVSNKKASPLSRTLAVLMAPIVGLWAFVESYATANLHKSRLARRLHMKNVAFVDGNAFEGVLGKVLTLIIVFAILGGVAVTFFTNLKTLVTTFNNTSATGNDTVDGFISVFGLIVAVLGVFALIKLVQKASGSGE